MVETYLTIIVPALIGAIIATIANYIYYRQTTHKESKTKFLERQITELLLPLDFHIKGIEKYYEIMEDQEGYYDYLRNDTKIEEIAAAKFYLASPKLRDLLLEFNNDQHKYYFQYQCGGRIGDYLNYVESLPDNFIKNYEKLRDTIHEECKEKIKEYQENYSSSLFHI